MNSAPRRSSIAWHRRLWVRIYVALVVFTLILAAIGLTTWELLNGFPGWQSHAAGDFAQRRPPPAPPELRGDRPPPPPDADRGDGPPHLARTVPQRRGPPLPIALVMFLITSAAMLVVAYPVARRLARSIERIAAPVNAFGAGDLSARAPEDGPGEVGVLGREFNEAADRIAALLRSQRSLLANASHELRSPLARIQMQLEQIGERSSADIRSDIRREIAELDELVEEILLSSRLQSEHRPALSEDVELLALAAEEAARVGAQAQGTLVTVRGDARLLRRVVRNMIENAVRYSDGSDSVEVLVSEDDGRAAVDVLDRGPGVPEAERERIFEPFYRARGAAEKRGGVGLGLSLSRQIAAEHGGLLSCLQRAGGGGHFRLQLPLRKA